jgi:uncharacterized protein with NRDE domain
MCVLALAWQAHPRWQLIVAGNRDEYHERPAAPLARWDDHSHLLAGRDLRSGGTWLGVSDEGRFTVVTNLRGHGDPAPDRPSRGALVTDLLTASGDHGDPDRIDVAAFNPVNLIFIDRARALFLSNRPQAVRTALAPGLYGLSNGRLDEPWPKTMRLKSILLGWMMGDATQPDALLAGLREEVVPDIGLGPTVASDVPQEPRDSAIFIRDSVYGTRCSSVVAIDRTGEGVFIERRYDAEAQVAGETVLRFRWPV